MDGEIVVERRRQWTPEAKAALMAEVEAEGGQVLVVAQRHGISKSLLYNWRSAWKAAGLAARARAVPPTEFVPVGVVAEASGHFRRFVLDRLFLRRKVASVAHIGCDSKAQVLWGLPGERLSHWSDPAR